MVEETPGKVEEGFRKNIGKKMFFALILGLVIVLATTVITLLLLNRPEPLVSSELSENVKYNHPGDYNLSINVNGMIRNYWIHVPIGYDDKTPLPLVIVLHWWGGNSKSVEEYTGFSRKADREKFIVIYPQGTGTDPTWNAGFCCGQALQNRVNDVEFIRRIVKKTMEDLKIDPKRVYVAGVSNGGMMAHRLGAELSDIFAAIAVVSGSIGKSSSGRLIIANPSKPVSVIIFHGEKDELVPYNGGGSMGYFFASINETALFWARANNCSQNPVIEISSNRRIVKTTYTGGLNNTEVVLYTITDGGHDIWNSAGIPMTDLIWDFFKKHPKQ
ncbi:MAG: dienelactone hydrolase family protein [Candidatus Brockarchaeota archaeon]|nr:dienelactone hydrolase family protein [Candidatus Brockarchaeota archaeon]